MRKTIINLSLLSFLLICTLNSQAQIDVGFKAGANYSKIAHTTSSFETSDIIESDYIVGYHAGAFFRYRINGWLLTQADLLYNTKGSKNIYETGMNVKLDYVSLPVSIIIEPVNRIWIEGGVELSHLLNSDQEDVVSSDSDLNVHLGLTVQVTQRIGIHGRYSYGMLNLDKFTVTDLNGQPVSVNNQNRTWQLSLSYAVF